MRGFRLIFLILGLVGFLLAVAGNGMGGDTTPADMSAKYGDGPHVAYTFNNDYTAYGLGRGATKDEAAQRAKDNCTGTGCGDGERGYFMPGCFAMFRLPDGKYQVIREMRKLSEDEALKMGKAAFGEDCQLEVILCSN